LKPEDLKSASVELPDLPNHGMLIKEVCDPTIFSSSGNKNKNRKKIKKRGERKNKDMEEIIFSNGLVEFESGGRN
jgi:hypothetical protein